MNTEQKKRLKKVIITGCILGIACIAYLIVYHFTGIGVPCVLNRYTGLKCPVCGLMHMLTSILMCDLAEAFYYNRVLFIMLPVIAAIFADNTLFYIIKGTVSFPKAEKAVIIFLTSVLIIWGVYRNVAGI